MDETCRSAAGRRIWSLCRRRSQHRIWLVAGVPAPCQMPQYRAEAHTHFNTKRRKHEKRQTIQHSNLSTGFRNNPPKSGTGAHEPERLCDQPVVWARQIIILDGLKEVLRQQKAIGNNLNQLTVLANMGKVQFANLDAAAQEFAKINTALREMQEGGAAEIAIVHFVNYKKGTQTRGCMKSVMRYVSQTQQDALGWAAARQRYWLSAGNGVRRVPEYEAAAPQRRRRDVLPHGAEFPEGCGR